MNVMLRRMWQKVYGALGQNFRSSVRAENFPTEQIGGWQEGTVNNAQMRKEKEKNVCMDYEICWNKSYEDYKS